MNMRYVAMRQPGKTAVSFVLALVMCLVCTLVSACGAVPSDASQPEQTQHNTPANRALQLPAFYGESMVLQRDKPISIRGSISGNRTYADASNISVTLTQGTERHAAAVTMDGDAFTAVLPALPASERPYSLTLEYGDHPQITIHKVYIGDVFVAAGQSNMELNYAQYYEDPKQAANNMGSALTHANLPELVKDSGIHFMVAAHDVTTKDFPADHPFADGWKPCTGEYAKHLGYLPQLFAQRLRKKAPHVPIGIIQTAWGGTGIDRHVRGGDIYNNHIVPLTGFHIAAVLWYQGCDDAWQLQRALEYEPKFTALINEYRNVFGQSDLPFLYVQLARWTGARYTPFVRQAQLATLDDPNIKQPKNLAMTVSIDTDKGTSTVIHPLGKDILAARMAEQWQAIQHNSEIPSSPLANSAVRQRDGSVVVKFRKGTAQGLQAMSPNYTKSATVSTTATASAEPVRGIEVAGNDDNFVPASTSIHGNSIVVKTSGNMHITQVRYLWSGNPTSDSLLYNSQKLPASPFILSVS